MGTYKGSCFCGSVEFEVTGEPEVMGYCHCDSCRRWSAGPVNAFSLWKPESVKVTKGANKLGHFMKTETSDRKFCMECGGHVLTEHPTWGITDVYAATIPSLLFKPALHVNYAETVLRIPDGLPKFKDMPSDAGGSGEEVPE